MSAEDANLQAQVEAVLGTLVKAATVELIKLFESSFRVSAGPSRTQRAGGKETPEVTDTLSAGATKRSVGVQVEPQGTFGMLNFLFLPSCAGGESRRLGLVNWNTLLCCHGCWHGYWHGFSFMHRSSTSRTVLVHLHRFRRGVEECAAI